MDISKFKKEGIELEGEKLLTLEQIADVFSIPSNIIKILFHQEYIKKNIIKENKDYYIIPKEILSVFNIRNNDSTVFISLTGFIEIALDLIKNSKSDIDQKIKSEQLKLIVREYYYNYSSTDKLKFKLSEIKEELKEKEKEKTSVNYMNNNTTVWRKQSNKAINSLVRISNLSFEEVRQKIYRELELKAGCNLEARLNNMKKRAALNGFSKTKISTFNYLDVIATDKVLINMYLNEISLLARKYNVKIILQNVA